MDVEQRARAVFGLSWADYWMERGQTDVAHDFDAFSRAEAWALQHFPAALTPPEGYVVVEARIFDAMREFVTGFHGMSRNNAENLAAEILDDLNAKHPEVKP